ncbi:hypothetical protein D3C87_1587120 [compost metagenome]
MSPIWKKLINIAPVLTNVITPNSLKLKNFIKAKERTKPQTATNILITIKTKD